jgi:membrane protein implicated in regulation of membrane protease activity
MWTAWWAWVAGGFALGVFEVLTPGYVFLGFAIGAVLTGALIGFGLVGENLPVLLTIFAVASLLAWIVLRRTVGVRENQVKLWDRDINDGD